MPLTVQPPDDGAASEADTTTAYQQALLRERDGYIARGAHERVMAVEAALVASGFELVERATAPAKGSRATKAKE